MNRELILKLADQIEKSKSYSQGEQVRIKLTSKGGESCGTPGCISGHCVVMHSNFDSFEGLSGRHFFGKDGRQYETSATAAKMLELNYKQAKDLFSPVPYGFFRPSTAKDAARTLRYLAATGKVDWTVTDGQAKQALTQETI